MATASEVKFLEEVGEDLLCCTICLEKFKSPKTLPCLHTFCEKCLVTLVEKTGSQNMLHCPECRQQYQLPVGGVPAMKDNFFMCNLIDIFNRQLEFEIFNRRLESMQEAEIDCEGCQENTATHRCMECQQYLCDSTCTKVHRNLLLTRAHTIMTIAEFETAKSAGPKTLQVVEYCGSHPKKKIRSYCETCQVSVCRTCASHFGHHIWHVLRDLKDAADEYITELKAMVNKLKVKEQEAEKNKILANQIYIDLTKRCSREERKVRMKAEEIINKTKIIEQRLIDELKNKYKIIEKTGSLKCRECRDQYKHVGEVPAIKTLKGNLIEIFKSRLESMQEAETECEGCQENTATHRCEECKQYLCDSICTNVHRNLSLTWTHTIMTIVDFETTKSAGANVLQAAEYCGIHPKNEIEFYCETCQVPGCANCGIAKYLKSEHVHRDLKDDETRTEMKAVVSKVKAEDQKVEKTNHWLS
ncbi:E3 ubiquitin-protein ligase TRIM56-like [Ptychodera flava]|uniref:E3 ubiquitin-protein ligase TRIM56-like n=1 Tax=Ptychodera flava TaxID=63121 RepID=UPI003969D51D